LEKVDLLIQGCLILPLSSRDIIKDGYIAIKNGEIVSLGKRVSADNMIAERVIDGRGKVAMPGLINCHAHVAMTLLRGIAEDKPLEKWLKEAIWPLEARLTPEDIYAGALLGCLEMIKSGTTCFADMYFHEEAVARAIEKSGLRASLAEGIIEAGNSLLGEKMLKASENFARNFNGYAGGRVTAMLGPHAAYSCSPALLMKVKETAASLNLGIHIHLAESHELFKDFEKIYGCSETQFLDRLGLFKLHTLAAHCIDLSEDDARILAGGRVNAVYVPVANMKLGLGTAKVRALMDLGVNVALGTDGPASNNVLDMFETMKVGALLQKCIYRNPASLSAYEVVRMATINGAKALGLERFIGSLEVGKRADIILIDLSKPHLKPLHDIYACLVYSARGGDVDTVIVDGKILMENRKVETLNEREIMEKAEKHAYNLINQEDRN